MNKVIITLLVIWAGSATVMAVKHRFDTVPQVPGKVSSVPAVKSAVDISAAADSGEISALKSEITNLRADNSRLTRELAAVKTQKVIENISSQVAKKDDAPQGKEMKKQLSKDVWKRLDLSMKTSQDKRIANNYGPLTKQLGMDPERQELFLAVMSEQGGPMQLMKLMGGGDADNKVLQKMLSADEYKAWQNYEKSMPVREAVQAFENNTGIALTEDQRERLVDIFQKNDYAGAGGINVSDDATAARSIDGNCDRLAAITEESRAVLTPEQQKGLDKYFGEQVANQELTAKANSKASMEAAQASESPAQEQGTVIRMPKGWSGQAVEVKTSNGAAFGMQAIDLRTMNGSE